MNNEKKIEEIKKYYKKDKTFLELYFKNYEHHNIYIMINYIKKKKVYSISWFDLDFIEKGKIDKYFSREYFPEEIINYIVEKYKDIDIPEYKVISDDSNIVSLNVDTKTKNRDNISISLNKYLPNELSELSELFVIVFDNLPRKLQSFLFEIHAILTDTVMKYEYGKEINFDLFNDNLNVLFANRIIERGRKYYEEGRVINLEKVDGKYFAAIKGNQKYSALIEYDEENKKIKMFCSCPCEFYCKHLYATILSIRNNDLKKFYKIIYQNPNQNILENMENSKFFLCIGLNDSHFEIINQYGVVEDVPIIDEKGNLIWKIVEDDSEKTLSKKVKEMLNKSNFII